VYSNRMEDAVKTVCCECESVVSLAGLTKHLRGRHGQTTAQYRAAYGDPRAQVLRMVHHRCALCATDVVLDYNVLAKHLRKAHRLRGRQFAEYNSTHLTMIMTRKLVARSSSVQATPVKEAPSTLAAFASPHTPTSSLASSPPPSSPASSISSPSSTCTSPRAPTPYCSACSRVFRSNMQLKMHKRREHSQL